MKSLAIVLLVLVIALVVWFSRYGRKRPAQTNFRVSPGMMNRSLLTPPVPFGYKTAWFAIHSEDASAVARALELRNPQPANWEYGLWHSIEPDDYSVFVTPPINGWILAVGVPILHEADGHATSRMVELSRQF